jgi:hypothetical protein
VLAGHDPASVRFPLVIDVARVLIIEVYRDYGMKFQEAMDELNSKLGETGEAQPAPRAPDNDASMAMLQALMQSSDFGGPKG